MDERFKCKVRNYKALRGKYQQCTLFDIHHSKILFDPPPRVMLVLYIHLFLTIST